MVTDKQNTHEHHERVRDVQRYIDRHMDRPLNCEVLASIAGFSIPHFHRIFTACTGESAAAYVRRARMERAARKLRMGAVDIAEIALAAGYDSHSAFSKAFKRHFGVSPEAFRTYDCMTATQMLRKGNHQ